MKKLAIGTMIALTGAALMAAEPVATVTTTVTPATSGITEFKFDDDGLEAVVHTSQLNTALINHDAAATFEAAKQLQIYELKKNAVNSVYNSAAVYKQAAISAAAQGNAPLLQQIVTVAPETKVIATSQVTVIRGAKKDIPAAIPQLVEVKYGDWDKLTPAQAPIWGDYIMAFYPQLNRAAAEIIANKVNSSRSMMASALLAEVAAELDGFKATNAPVAFQAKNVFTNAIDMAIFMRDKAALEKIIALYDKVSFKDAKVAKELEAELKAMSATRDVTEFNFAGGTTELGFGAGGFAGLRNVGGQGGGRVFKGQEAQVYMMLEAYK